MNKNVSHDVALCLYRNRPLANGYSPAQLLFGKSAKFEGIFEWLQNELLEATGDKAVETKQLNVVENFLKHMRIL